LKNAELVDFGWLWNNGKRGGLEGADERFEVVSGEWANVAALFELVLDNISELAPELDDGRAIRGV
jgi:hypothetical protein